MVKQWKEKKKKKKPTQEAEIPQTDIPRHRPVFGIPLADAAERTMLYDGIRLPAVFRECIDYVEKYGMKCEGIYRVSGIVTHLKGNFCVCFAFGHLTKGHDVCTILLNVVTSSNCK